MIFVKLFRVLRCALSKVYFRQVSYSFFLRYSAIRHCEKNTDPNGWVRGCRGYDDDDDEELSQTKQLFLLLCCWPKGILGGSAKWKLSPHVERMRQVAGRRKNCRIVRLGAWLSSVCIAYSTLPRSKCKSKCLCVPHGKGKGCAGGQAGDQLVWGVGGAPLGVCKSQKCTQTWSIRFRRAVANCELQLPRTALLPRPMPACLPTPARTQRCLARRFSKLKGF